MSACLCLWEVLFVNSESNKILATTVVSKTRTLSVGDIFHYLHADIASLECVGSAAQRSSCDGFVACPAKEDIAKHDKLTSKVRQLGRECMPRRTAVRAVGRGSNSLFVSRILGMNSGSAVKRLGNSEIRPPLIKYRLYISAIEVDTEKSSLRACISPSWWV